VSHKSNLDFSNLQGEKNYSGHDSYGRSKLCNILFTLKLDREIKQPGFITNCLDPGNINTKLLKKGWGAIGADISSGAKNVIDVVNVKNKSGKYYVRGKLSEPSKIAYDKKVQDKLWNKSIEMINNCNVEFKLKY
jgi:NAD(P)-dependent dehydrogenase (short-subunit alcohol dehydrogenase family)